MAPHGPRQQGRAGGRGRPLLSHLPPALAAGTAPRSCMALGGRPECTGLRPCRTALTPMDRSARVPRPPHHKDQRAGPGGWPPPPPGMWLLGLPGPQDVNPPWAGPPPATLSPAVLLHLPKGPLDLSEAQKSGLTVTGPGTPLPTSAPGTGAPLFVPPPGPKPPEDKQRSHPLLPVSRASQLPNLALLPKLDPGGLWASGLSSVHKPPPGVRPWGQ